MSKQKPEKEFNRRNSYEGGSLATLMTVLGSVTSAARSAPTSTSAGLNGQGDHKGSGSDADFLRAWMSSEQGAEYVGVTFRRILKLCSLFAAVAVVLLPAVPSRVLAAENTPSFIYETPDELFGSGDFDGDGRADVVIVDKHSGKYRLGYLTAANSYAWVDCRPSGLKDISSFSIGKLLATNLDALVFASPYADHLTVVAASNPADPDKPVVVPFTAALGPNTVVVVHIGGLGKTALADLYAGSIYNSPDPNIASLLRNGGAEFTEIGETTMRGSALRGNRLSLKAGQPELLCVLDSEDKGDRLQAEDLSSGKPVIAATAVGLPSGSDYTVGNFGGTPLREFVFYKPGQNTLLVRPVEEPAPGQFQLGKGSNFDLDQPVRRVLTLNWASDQRLLVIFGNGEEAGVFRFDGIKAPVRVQGLVASNALFTCAADLPDGLVVFSQPRGGKFSTKYQAFKATRDGYVPASFGSLPSLADNDNVTIADIHALIAANSKVNTEAEMKPYTNTLPGTPVTYVMLPIPGGEFVMGSPRSEAGRKPDEGPQCKVRIEPFWMEQCEVTWDEFELFTSPDEDKRNRAAVPADAAGDKLADAVTHPSRPYVDMSFGMGKKGCPAISMTQHAANKYCQWLSAKTGHFYRLPTEAEWEYAARAGTITAYFFGDDASKLGDYAWFEENSDFKYQKVGKKKPNPWGLYDIYGNVVEWVLDQYDPDFYRQSAGAGPVLEPWNKATKPYPHSVRGGSWDDEAGMCRSAARRGSERAWKLQDPQNPKSIWYFSDAQWVGFRVIRPLKVPSPEEMQKYWSSGVERD